MKEVQQGEKKPNKGGPKMLEYMILALLYGGLAGGYLILALKAKF